MSILCGQKKSNGRAIKDLRKIDLLLAAAGFGLQFVDLS